MDTNPPLHRTSSSIRQQCCYSLTKDSAILLAHSYYESQNTTSGCSEASTATDTMNVEKEKTCLAIFVDHEVL